MTRDGDGVSVGPRSRLTDEHRAAIREHKAELLRDLDTEAMEVWRAELLGMLADRPGITRAFIAEPRPGGAGVVRLAIRGIGTCELLIPEGRYDALGIVRLFEELDPTQGTALVDLRAQPARD